MKLAFVFPPMWTPHSDGSLQIWNREVTTRLSKDCDVMVYSGLFSPQAPHCINGVRYRHISTRWDQRSLKRLQWIHKALKLSRPLYSSDLWFPIYALKVALDLRKQGCDVVHVYNYPQFASLIKFFNPGCRVILNMHGEWLTQIKFTNIHARLRKIDLVISCSDFITRSTRARFPEIARNCWTAPMGISPGTFSRTRDDDNPEKPSPMQLLYVGRISPEKGVHVLLDAFEIIVRRYPDAALTIVGPEWIAPRADIVDLCLEKDVIATLAPFFENGYLSLLKEKQSPEAAKRTTFTGLVAHADVLSFYEHADIYISPSLYESFGMSVIEAMAAGLPVVAGRIKSFEDLILNGHTGLLVEANNPLAIAEAVISVFENPQVARSMSSAAGEMILARFSWDTISSFLLDVYREILNTNVPSSGFPKYVSEKG